MTDRVPHLLSRKAACGITRFLEVTLASEIVGLFRRI